jgi:hypothetical protein
VTGKWFTAHSTSRYHFLKVEVNNCRLRLDAIDTAGTVFDSYEIDRCYKIYLPIIARYSGLHAPSD